MSLAPVMGPLRSLAGYTKCQPRTIQVDSFLRLVVNCIVVFHTQFNTLKEKEPKGHQSDDAENDDDGDVDLGVAGLATSEESFALHAVVGVMPEAGEAADLG